MLICTRDKNPEDLLREARETLEKCRVNEPVCGFVYPFIAPGGYGSNWWQLDSSSALEGCRYLDFPFSVNAIRNFMLVQKPDGRIPLYGPDILPRSPNHPPQSEDASSLPVLFIAAVQVAEMYGDEKFAAEVVDMLSRYLEWWVHERQDPDTGLITSLFEETFPPYNGYAGEYAGVDTNVLVAMGAMATARLAERIGNKPVAKHADALGWSIFSAAESFLWDEKAQIFRGLDLNEGNRGPEAAEGFYMFNDPQLPEKRRTRMLSRLKGADFGWRAYPLTSMARRDPSFTITRGDHYMFNRSWSGMVWTLINRFVISGLECQNCAPEALALSMKTLEITQNECREFYAPDDALGHGAKDYAWTAAHRIRILLEDVLGISYDGFGKKLTVAPAVSKGRWEVRDLACGNDGFADIVIENGKVTDARFRGQTAVEMVYGG